MKRIDASNYLDTLTSGRKPWHARYYAMYSSVLGGVVTDPLLMQVPADDHLVHRGDGVFDTFKCVKRAAYNLNAHLKRLVRSGCEIGLTWPGGIDAIRALTVETLTVADRDDCSCRVILARGPGSFGVSPYESPEAALYVIVYGAGQPFMSAHPEGARLKRSRMPVKSGNLATFKHCNYLPNVLMKREAIDSKVDFVLSFDHQGFLAEGATENVGMITTSGELLFPKMTHVLDGTTMLRVMQMAEALVADGSLKRIAFADISEAELMAAPEVLVVGTTLNVASAVVYEGRIIGEGKQGPIGQRLDRMLAEDIATNQILRTEY